MMNYSIEFTKPSAELGVDWLLDQEVNVLNEQGGIIAKAELQLLTMNKHRGAKATYDILADQVPDWEIPLNIYFKKHNLTDELCQELKVPTSAKAQTHIMIEALSVLPEYRSQGFAKALLAAIAKEHNKAQSVNVLSMPMHQFVTASDCETEEHKAYYTQLDLVNDELTREGLKTFFEQLGFVAINIDESTLIEPLSFDVFVASPPSILSL